MRAGPFALSVILLALLIDVTLGEPPTRFHPVCWMGSLLRSLSQHALTIDPCSAKRRFLAGAALLSVSVALFATVAFAAEIALSHLPGFVSMIFTALLLKPMFAAKGLLSAADEIRLALERNDLSEARRLTGYHLVSRDTSTLSESEIVSAVIESIAENLTDSFFAPLVAYAVGGLPFAWAYRTVNTADAMIGYRTEQWESIGKFAARSDDVLNWMPARICGMLICAAAALVNHNGRQALRIMLRDHKRTTGPNPGWTMAAIAGALNIQLKKRDTYVLNADGAIPQRHDIQPAMRIIRTAMLLGIVLLCAVLFE